ncbi:hypothetical protein AUJ67_02695 [Candidatus Desantisbacteria bacterium CG1_02_49_89]|nr:MAG: hypothetical protein AUJ67_02695 [Candidatus Desantisbacteria bacterium CG1_02_49_89]
MVFQKKRHLIKFIFIILFFTLSVHAKENARIPIKNISILKDKAVTYAWKENIRGDFIIYIYKDKDENVLNSIKDHGENWRFNEIDYTFDEQVNGTGKTGEWWVAADGKTIVVVTGPDQCDNQENKQETDKPEGDPVNPGLGGLIFSIEDLNIPTPGISIKFRRTYKSIFSSDGPLGYGWVDNINQGLLGFLCVKIGHFRVPL